MTNPCDIEISAGYAGDSATHRVGALHVSAGFAASVLAIGLSMAVVEQAQAADFTEGPSSSFVLEQATASDSTAPQRTTRITRLERAKAADLVRHVLSDSLVGVGLAADLLLDRPQGLLIERATAASLVEARTLATGIASSRASARDLPLNRYQDVVAEAAVASDLQASLARSAGSVLDAAQAGDWTEDGAAAGRLLIDRAMAASFTQGSATGGSTLLDDADASEFAVDGRDSAALWTCEAATFGMSRLLPGAVHDLALVDGVLCACSPEGLVAFDAPAAAPLIRTGLTDFGSPAMKRASYVYVGYQGEPPTLAVGNTGSGQEVTYSYPLPARTAEAATPARAALGRGARSRYWRFTLTGTVFALHDVTLEIAETSRKI